MYPASSVSGWYFNHPGARSTFGVGKIAKRPDRRLTRSAKARAVAETPRSGSGRIWTTIPR